MSEVAASSSLSGLNVLTLVEAMHSRASAASLSSTSAKVSWDSGTSVSPAKESITKRVGRSWRRVPHHDVVVVRHDGEVQRRSDVVAARSDGEVQRRNVVVEGVGWNPNGSGWRVIRSNGRTAEAANASRVQGAMSSWG